MAEREPAASGARRRTRARRNLDTALKFGGVSWQGCTVVGGFLVAIEALDLFTDFGLLLFGDAALPVFLGATVGLFFVFRRIERAQDRHHVFEAARYLWERPWSVIYSAGVPEGPLRVDVVRILKVSRAARGRER